MKETNGICESFPDDHDRFHAIVEHAPIAMAVVGMDGVIEFINRKAIKVFGYEYEDIPDMDSWWSLAYPDETYRKETIIRWTNLVKSAITGGKEIEGGEYRVTCKDKTVRNMLISGVFVSGKIFVLFDDISERKRAEDALRESEENFRVLFEENPLPTLLSEMPSGIIAYVNKCLAESTGLKPDEIIGKTANELNLLSFPDDQKKLTNLIAVKGYVDNLEVRKKYPDGSLGTDLISMRLIKMNRKMYCLTIIQDITERKRMEEELLKAQKLESLGVLAGGIAHDFNNLLTGIFGFIDLARSATKDTKAYEYLEAVMPAMNRARSLTLQLLTFSKGGSPVQKTTPLMPFIMEAAQFALSGSNVNGVFNIPETLWWCNIDKNQIGQVIDNIVINAQQAMPDGGTIVISAENISIKKEEHPLLLAGIYVKVSIADSGIGIPKQILSRIFDPFFTTKIKGHGLGLSTCYSIVKRHGGAIEVESEPGKGSTFHIYLPASLQNLENAEAQKATMNQHKSCGKIIIMDDEEIVRNALFRILESLGYASICVKDGKEALACYLNETANGETVAAMIVDLTVPGGMGGVDVASELRKTNKVIPIFVSSGYSENSVMKNPADYGFTASISKPFLISDISKILTTAIESVSSNQALF